MLSLGTFTKFGYDDQSTRGDMSKLGLVPDIKAKIRVDLVEFDVSEIKRLKINCPLICPSAPCNARWA